MIKNFIRIITMILLIITFLIIFGFSNQNGETSGGISEKVSKILVNIFDFNKKTEEEKQITAKKIEPIIRKIAHFLIYTVVGFLMMSFMSTYDSVSLKKKILISLIVGFIYACSDEIHQAFIPDRSPAVTDVLIDTAGVCLGISIVSVLYRLIIKN